MVSATLAAGGSIAAINLAESIYRRTDMIPPFLITYSSASALRMARLRQSILQKHSRESSQAPNNYETARLRIRNFRCYKMKSRWISTT